MMIGGAGNDTYYVDNVGDTITEYNDGSWDIVYSTVSYTLATHINGLYLQGVDGLNGTGNDSTNELYGNGAANVLTSLGGNDYLDGGAGTDTLIGGLGDDTYVVDNTGDIVTELAGEGTDTVQSSITYSLVDTDGAGSNGGNVENLTLTGTTAINGTGNALNNVITGNSGNNTLNGGAGADTMIGGAGNDTYTVDNVGDIVVENSGGGTDTVNSSVSYTLAANVENLNLSGASALNGTGNDLSNSLVGNAAINTLQGGLGTDTLKGLGGADILDGGAGTDTATYAGSAAVQVNLLAGTATGGDAQGDTLIAIENLTGSSNADQLTGDAGNNVLDGGAGADQLTGGLGDDTYVVDNAADIVTELAGEGTDTVLSSITYSLVDTDGAGANGGNLENLTLTGTTAINGTGNALDNILTGNTGANTLIGGAGNDTLNGGTGADTMIGGTGDDIYSVDNTADVVTENAGEGTDTVRSGITYTLGTNLENLTLTGTGAINGTGNTAANLLIGNGAANTLNGADGNDILQGMAGNDTLNDALGNNVLDAGAGTDTIVGNTGNELIIGGTGIDTITTSTGYDVIAFNTGDGQDTINASTGADNTLSLGGGIKYADMTLSKSGNNLILKTGGTDQITLKDWYASTSNHSVLNLQVIAEAMADFASGGTDVLKDNKIETFNFAGLVDRFDQARAANGTLSNWALTNALLDFHLGSGSDTDAIGGDLAYQYGKAGTLAGIGLNASQSVINSAQFGQSAQTLHAASTWQAETVKLG